LAGLMALKSRRRIGAPVGPGLHDQLGARVLSNVYWRSGTEATEREHPELIIEREGNLLSVDAVGGAKLIYGFENQRAFVDHFADMFEELLPRLRESLGVESVRFRLSYSPARPVVEPVLRGLWFSPSRDWLWFMLGRGAKLPPATVRGVKFREATPADVEAVVRVDDECFPNTPIPLDAMLDRLHDKRHEIVVATSAGEVIGFYDIEHPEEGVGWISIIAVSQGHRGRGVGRALTVRATKRLFALGAREVGLSADQDNARAIRLYVSLGFRQEQAGREYARPTDPAQIQQMRVEREGTLIRFGGWR
jgi:ribosomal protein S18 acetylase RimI-like enzyme